MKNYVRFVLVTRLCVPCQYNHDDDDVTTRWSVLLLSPIVGRGPSPHRHRTVLFDKLHPHGLLLFTGQQKAEDEARHDYVTLPLSLPPSRVLNNIPTFTHRHPSIHPPEAKC